MERNTDYNNIYRVLDKKNKNMDKKNEKSYYDLDNVGGKFNNVNIYSDLDPKKNEKYRTEKNKYLSYEARKKSFKNTGIPYFNIKKLLKAGFCFHNNFAVCLFCDLCLNVEFKTLRDPTLDPLEIHSRQASDCPNCREYRDFIADNCCLVCCEENVPFSVTLPCAHSAMCVECSGKFDSCPLCKTAILRRVEIKVSNIITRQQILSRKCHLCGINPVILCAPCGHTLTCLDCLKFTAPEFSKKNPKRNGIKCRFCPRRIKQYFKIFFN